MVGGLYRGTVPNIGRNCIINVGETVVYDAVKDSLLSSGRLADGVPLHLASAVVAGVTATFVASPVDVIKTRSAKYSNRLTEEREIPKRDKVYCQYYRFPSSIYQLLPVTSPSLELNNVHNLSIYMKVYEQSPRSVQRGPALFPGDC